MTRHLSLALFLALTACDGLADDSLAGVHLGQLRGRLTGAPPDDPALDLAMLWRPANHEDAACEAGHSMDFNSIVQPLEWSQTGDGGFLIDLIGSPPAGTLHALGWPNDYLPLDASAPEADGAVGVVTAYRDDNGNGQLDLCHEVDCPDTVLGMSNIEPVFSSMPDHEAHLGAFSDSPSSILFLTAPWRPYGVREIPAGYAVQRADADLAAGERFLDAFDPAVDIEVPLIGVDDLVYSICDGGCSRQLAHGDPTCPDLETAWCTFATEMAPADAVPAGTRCEGAAQNNIVWCTHVWVRISGGGCAPMFETWYGCPYEDPENPPADPWYCL